MDVRDNKDHKDHKDHKGNSDVLENEHDRNDYYKRYNNDKKIQGYLIRSFGPLVFDILLKL